LDVFAGGTGQVLAGATVCWIRHRRARLIVIYAFSLAVTVSTAFGLREVSLALTTHVILPEQRIAAVSFLSGDEQQLRDLIQSAEGAGEVQHGIKAADGWLLVQEMKGKRPVVHVMIDAGMERARARILPLADEGVKLVFSRARGGIADGHPFGTSARWRPAFITEAKDGKVSHLITLDQDFFVGNPMMPVF
jgi:hypothetical protein